MVDSWIIYASISLVMFGVMNFLLKLVSNKTAVPLLVVIIYVSSLMAPLGYFLYTGEKFQLTNNFLIPAILIGVIGSVSFIVMTYALRVGTASQVIPVVNLNTLVTVALAVLILNEKLTPKVGLGILFAIVSLYLLTS